MPCVDAVAVVSAGSPKILLLSLGICELTHSFLLSYIVGQSTLGKSTLLRTLSQLKLQGLSVSIEEGEAELSAMPKAFLRQEDDTLYFGKMLPCDYLHLSARIYGVTDEKLAEVHGFTEQLFDRGKEFRGVAESTLFNAYFDTPIEKLSGGQRKILSIAVTLLLDPELLLLDEPLSGLDSVSCVQVLDALKYIAETQGCIILLVIHQPSDAILEKFERVIVLRSSKLVCDICVPAKGVRNSAKLLEKHLFLSVPALEKEASVRQLSRKATSLRTSLVQVASTRRFTDSMMVPFEEGDNAVQIRSDQPSDIIDSSEVPQMVGQARLPPRRLSRKTSGLSSLLGTAPIQRIAESTRGLFQEKGTTVSHGLRSEEEKGDMHKGQCHAPVGHLPEPGMAPSRIPTRKPSELPSALVEELKSPGKDNGEQSINAMVDSEDSHSDQIFARWSKCLRQVRPIMLRAGKHFGWGWTDILTAVFVFVVVSVMLYFEPLFPAQVVLMTLGLVGIPVFLFPSRILEYTLLWRAHKLEMDDRKISLAAFQIGSAGITFPVPVIALTIALIPAYAITGWSYETFVVQAIFSLVHLIITLQFGRVLGVIFRGDIGHVIKLYTLVMFISFAFSSVPIASRKVPPGLRWLFLLSIFFWAVSGAVLNQFDPDNYSNDDKCFDFVTCLLSDGAFIVHFLGFAPMSTTFRAIGILTGVFILLVAAEYILLRYQCAGVSLWNQNQNCRICPMSSPPGALKAAARRSGSGGLAGDGLQGTMGNIDDNECYDA